MSTAGLRAASPAWRQAQPVSGAMALRGGLPKWRRRSTHIPGSDFTKFSCFNSPLCHHGASTPGFHPERPFHFVRPSFPAVPVSPRPASVSSFSYSTAHSPTSAGSGVSTPSPSAAAPVSAPPAALRFSLRWLWRLVPLAFPIVGYGYYWEQRRRRMYTEVLPALQSRFQGDTPFYGKLWGSTTDYFLETSFADGDLVFFARDPHSLSFSRAVARAVSRFLLLILPAGGSSERTQRIGTGGGMFVDDIGVVYVENGQRYVVSLSTETKGLEKTKYAKKIAESFPETILVRRLRCSPDVREKLHHALKEALRQSDGGPSGEKEVPDSVSTSPSRLPARPLNFRTSRVSVWSSFWTEMKRRRAASGDAFRLLTAQAFWTAKRRTAVLLERRLEDLILDVESVVPANVMDQARQKTLTLLSEQEGNEKEGGQTSERSASGTSDRADAANDGASGPGSREANQKEREKTAGETPGKPRGAVDVVADLLALSAFAQQAVKRIDNVFQDTDSPRPPAPAPRNGRSRLPIAAFPVAIYQAAQLLPPTPACRAWTPEDLLVIDTLFQPRDLPPAHVAAKENKNRGAIDSGGKEATDVKPRRADLARKAAVELASLSPQLAPILYVREEKGERDCVARKNMPGLMSQRERSGRNAAASGASESGTKA
ncbi:conserved hypothetical protein [Neospora caninum Liverpool]|uniref:Uncharacterized protein n=1 Tax=Neospora caninum (strain Liverpool) TaxID=572307 RepID=F0VRF5_NEOCL|nr:conserved hypothetical protein [Neospora caninum Liverpool]CBZ56303.1 conserved hypothetical protein [Neospora caninum Liverpool]CEL71065.1 TPA: hypothetical protein BN1204_067280 [Neospora caninum Liverpool]|eukprot:XP_003886328.1 conserved hypothetical protein [Neospora caninum Liverpool]